MTSFGEQQQRKRMIEHAIRDQARFLSYAVNDSRFAADHLRRAEESRIQAQTLRAGETNYYSTPTVPQCQA